MGQPIDKSRGPRRNSSSENGAGLPNGYPDSAESQQMLLRRLPSMGQLVVREPGRVDVKGCALVSGRRGGQDETNLDLLLTQLCSSRANHNAEQQLKKMVTDADETLQSD